MYVETACSHTSPCHSPQLPLAHAMLTNVRTVVPVTVSRVTYSYVTVGGATQECGGVHFLLTLCYMYSILCM